MNTGSLRRRIERALAEPRQELGRWARFVRFQINLWRFCARRLRENNVMAMSAALSFRTIFALIPVLVLAFLVLKSVGVLEDGKRGLRGFLEASGFAQIFVVEGQPGSTTAPATESKTEKTRAINVAEQIEDIVAHVESKLTFERIGPIGGALLIWTALTLLTTVERSLNRIFEAPRSRALGRRILLYWSAVTLGPVALAVAAYQGRQVMSAFGDLPGLAWLLVGIGWVGPVIVGILVVSALYSLMPNTAVRYRAAVAGAAVAVPLWLLAKWGFSVYVERLVVTGNLYGVLGVFPLFLMWLNLSWLIFLFGAELAHSIANLHSLQQSEHAERTVLGPSAVLAAAVAVGQSFAAEHGPVALAQVAAGLRLPPESVRGLIDPLIARGFVCVAEGEDREPGYLLARPAGTIPVAEILALGDSLGAGNYVEEIAAPVARVQSGARSALAGVTLADMLDDTPRAAGSQRERASDGPARDRA